LYGNDDGDDGHPHFIEDRFTMDIIATELHIVKNDAHDRPARTVEVGFVQGATVENLDVVTVASNPVLPTDRKWAIRFNPNFLAHRHASY
jgi:hypothetical protein